MVDLNDHKCTFEYTDDELLEQGKLDIQVRSHGIRDDRTFLEQYIVLEEIGKRWIREHENMKKENTTKNIALTIPYYYSDLLNMTMSFYLSFPVPIVHLPLS